ncbi:type III polyketide synthase [Allorhodopirellula solitaria]|uniref:Alpha-pyrone synthesis polyketide synthase-like Pks18 n=1 Tax=Allorhodopirellula solitaria TaxID=2527987 RepID=A0A5C5XNB1_9BACT|nr:type III polyketide synthase [Allorhodopirellula solitaria]TWT64647.1 Alpha-pyrone synthesis polyketide synthase-like Pks18 [Allorhodopirellula solitaria]
MAHLLSVASATPRHQADRALATAQAQRMSCRTPREADTVEKLFRRAGVETRGSVLLDEPTPGTVTQSFYQALSVDSHGPTTDARNQRFVQESGPLAQAAAARAVEQAGCHGEQFTHLITVTCTGFGAPGFDIDLIQGLGLPATTQRVQIGFMGCHALINAFRTARGLVAADPAACVLISSVELCSLHYQYGYDAQRIVSGSLFADGAAAAVVAGRDFAADHRQDPTPEILATGSCLVPESRDAMTWSIGNHGFEMTLRASVPGLIEASLASYLSGWLADHGLDLGSIGGWAVHPGGVRILDAVETSLGLAPEQLQISRSVLRQHGNMSSATLGMVLEQFARSAVPRPWLMLGFGPGLEIEVALIR